MAVVIVPLMMLLAHHVHILVHVHGAMLDECFSG
jgi:hypothetical protein